jgi:hypothetical protein
MAPPPISPFWREVKAQAIAGTLVIVIGGIFGGTVYLIHTVPTKLDEVLRNQTEFKGRLDSLEHEVEGHTERIIRLEAK